MVVGVRSLTLALLLSAFVVPGASAADCSAVTEDAVAVGDYYVVDAGNSIQLWQESNRVDGLQRQGCSGENGRDFPADTLVASIPTAINAPTLPPVPSPFQPICPPITIGLPNCIVIA